jgi:hypothetical protein
MNKKYLQGIMVAYLLISCSGAFAAGEWLTGKISMTLSDSNNYGKCMIRSPSFAPVIDCLGEWVSLSCSGDFNSKEDARRMWDSAQLAVALDLNVELYLVDTEKQNGYCVVKRLDVVK